MPVTTFAVPILSGKTEMWKKALAEIKGARKAEHAESRRRHGITREIASLQSTPEGDYVVVCLEGEDPAGLMAMILNSDDPFDRWFAEAVLTGSHGVKPSGPLPPPNELFLDWKA
jgi:hypothetical protein